MPTDFFGCLHTEEVRGHKVRVLTLFSKKTFICVCPAERERTFGGNPPRRGRGVPKYNKNSTLLTTSRR